MESDDLKTAWQAIERRLARQEDLHLELLKAGKLDQVRRRLRPLFWGQVLQVLLGLALIALGVACWTRNTGTPGLLAAGLTVHAFGVINIIAASLTLTLMARLDASAPVLELQKRFALLKRFYTLNGIVCGLPWWILWVVVVLAIAGLGHEPSPSGTPLWIWINLGVGAAGVLATWAFYLWSQSPGRPRLAKVMRDAAAGASLREAQALLDEIREFEWE